MKSDYLFKYNLKSEEGLRAVNQLFVPGSYHKSQHVLKVTLNLFLIGSIIWLV